MFSIGFLLLIAALTFVVSGLIAHFVAENRGRQPWEPWAITAVAGAMAVGCMTIMPNPLFVFALAPLPPGAMFLFRRVRGPEDPLIAPCPHCRDDFIVDVRFGGQPVTCPNCKQLFLGPKVSQAHT